MTHAKHRVLESAPALRPGLFFIFYPPGVSEIGAGRATMRS